MTGSGAFLFSNLISLCFLFSSCSDSLKGQNGCSDNIVESKEDGVFVKELFAPMGEWTINNTLSVNVESAWIEHHWKHGTWGSKPIIIDGYQIVVLSRESDLSSYNKKWMIGVDGKNYFRASSKSSLISDMDEIKDDSLLIWQVQEGSSLSPFLDHVIVGVVSLQSKK